MRNSISFYSKKKSLLTDSSKDHWGSAAVQLKNAGLHLYGPSLLNGLRGD